VQAFAWPALAKLFMAWFPRPEDRGRWYALLATCQNAGAAVVPYLLAAAASRAVPGWPGGWQGAVLLPAGLLAAMAAAVWLFVPDLPRRAAVAAVDRAQASTTAPAVAAAAAAASGQARAAPPAAATAPAPIAALASPKAAVGVWQTLALVLGAPSNWLLGSSYFCNTFLRNALTEIPTWLLGATGLRLAPGTLALAVSAYEVGAAGGGLGAGWISDRCFGGRRGPAIALLSLLAAPVPLLLLLCSAPTDGGNAAGQTGASGPLAAVAAALAQSPLAALAGGGSGREACVVATYFLAGLLAFGPHVLNGLASREYADRRVQASAGGFTKALGQLGGTAAGYPLGLLLHSHGWRAVVWVLAAVGFAAGLLALPLWRVRSFEQSAKKEAGEAASVAPRVAWPGKATGAESKKRK
jgi:sugar phosphate permease